MIWILHLVSSFKLYCTPLRLKEVWNRLLWKQLLHERMRIRSALYLLLHGAHWACLTYIESKSEGRNVHSRRLLIPLFHLTACSFLKKNMNYHYIYSLTVCKLHCISYLPHGLNNACKKVVILPEIFLYNLETDMQIHMKLLRRIQRWEVSFVLS